MSIHLPRYEVAKKTYASSLKLIERSIAKKGQGSVYSL